MQGFVFCDKMNCSAKSLTPVQSGEAEQLCGGGGAALPLSATALTAGGFRVEGNVTII